MSVRFATEMITTEKNVFGLELQVDIRVLGLEHSLCEETSKDKAKL